MTQSMPAGTQCIVRTIDLIKALGARRQIGWRLTDLATHCGLSTSTTHRIMTCLSSMRLARQRADDKRYVPGPALYEFALSVPSYFHFQQACNRSLVRISTRTRLVAFLALRSCDETVCIDREGSTSVNIMNEVGRRLPMAGSSLGVAMLLRLPKREQQQILAASRKSLRSKPSHRGRAYDEMWRRSQQRGIGLNLGDILPGGGSMSVAIVDAGDQPVAAIGVAGPLTEFSEHRIAATKKMLEDEATRIAREQRELIAALVV